MSYQVLARKWRPRTFRDLVGQEHVLKALVNALDHDRLHHAYLFTGTRGVGKTTIARILAKCLNCETGVSSEPCGQCAACVEIAENRFVDLIEVDAASRTKVEDTRELLENVQYAPTRGRYKVYLIDEVHMLSTHSFNALLKTLEEPPPHVKFLLATTDPQRLPVTILSRCLQFNLKNMTPELVTGHLQHVLETEMVPFEESALWQLGRAADGSMRDALSLTDQAIAFGSGKVVEADVRAMLGTIDRSAVYDMVLALTAGDGKQVLDAVAQMAEHAPDFASALADILSILHRVAIAQALPEAVDNSHGDREQILQLAQQLPAEDVQLFYQTGLIGRRDLPLAPDPRAGLEMVLLRMLAFRPQGVADVPTRALASGSPNPAHGAATQVAQVASDTNQAPPAAQSAAPLAETTAAAAPVPEAQEAPAERPPQPPAASQEPVTPASQSAEGRDNSAHPQRNDNEDSAPDYEPYDDSGSQAAAEYEQLAGQAHNESSASQSEPQPAEPASAPAVEVPWQVDEPAAAPSQPAATPSEPAAQSPSPAQPEVASSPAPPELKSAPEPIAMVSLADTAPLRWPEIYLGLSVGGVMRNTAANCELVGRQGNQLHFILDEQNSSLYDESHQQRLADILNEYYGEPVSVVIQPGQVQTETPAQIATRKQSERYEQAVESVKSDPIVQQLVEHFAATLDEVTVEPIDQN
ncbi:DNA polymerase III subunit gamma/tau [uncultured Gilvimarinus sp.]|uniref:DNA polymerase III subunit gamma/tau n=1 Tax=uncultured Gilvimarinus sp. TaxID=1689143 RepID=UPI0030EC1A7F